MSIIYRTSGPWGPGTTSDLAPAQVDQNFWQLFQDIQAKAVQGVGISNFQVTGNQMYVVLTDHTLLGPYTLPTAQLTFKGEWQPSYSYNANDIITHGGSTYMVLVNHISAATFDPNASIGGKQLYGLLLQNPACTLPTGGAPGTFLRKVTSADFVTTWETTALTDLSNVSIASPTEGQVLTYLHGIWTNSIIVAALHQLTDVNLGSLVTGQVLTWGGTFWQNANPITRLEGLSDVSIVGPVAGQALVWSGSPNVWVNQTLHFNLSALSDVLLTTLYGNQPLIYNSTAAKWENMNAADMLLQDIGNQAGSFTLDFTSYEFNRFSMSGPCSPTFLWPNRPGQFVRRAVEITNTSTFAFTFPAGIKWPGGVMPTVSYNGVDVFVFFSHDAGTTVYGNTVGQAYVPG